MRARAPQARHYSTGGLRRSIQLSIPKGLQFRLDIILLKEKQWKLLFGFMMSPEWRANMI